MLTTMSEELINLMERLVDNIRVSVGEMTVEIMESTKLLSMKRTCDKLTFWFKIFTILG